MTTQKRKPNKSKKKKSKISLKLIFLVLTLASLTWLIPQVFKLKDNLSFLQEEELIEEKVIGIRRESVMLIINQIKINLNNLK